MAVFQLEQLDGMIEVVAFPQTFSEYGVHLRDEAPVMVCGEYIAADAPRILAAEIYPLDEVHKYFAKKVSIHVSAGQATEETLRTLNQTLRQHPGEVPVRFVIEQQNGEKIFVEADYTFKTSASQRLVKDIERHIGEETVFLEVNAAPYLRPTKKAYYARGGGNGD